MRLLMFLSSSNTSSEKRLRRCPYYPSFELGFSFLEEGFQAILLFLVALTPGMAIIYMEACE
jgi:hypothetical protein